MITYHIYGDGAMKQNQVDDGEIKPVLQRCGSSAGLKKSHNVQIGSQMKIIIIFAQ